MDNLEDLQNAETTGKGRRKAILYIGRRVENVLEEKTRQGRDEAGRDREWWHNALWTYVWFSVPKKPGETDARPDLVEQWYRDAEKKVTEKREAHANEKAATEKETTVQEAPKRRRQAQLGSGDSGTELALGSPQSKRPRPSTPPVKQEVAEVAGPDGALNDVDSNDDSVFDV